MAETVFAAVTAVSHDGLVREHNEDSVVAGSWTLCATTTLTPQTLFFPITAPLLVAVADGLGGHPAGEEASSLVVRRLAREGTTITDADAVRSVLAACNDEIYREARRVPERRAMGTTVAGAVLTGSDVLVFNVGDSRVYRVVEDGLDQVSVDDNEPAIAGRRSPVLTQCLGGSLDAEPIEPHVTSRALTPPERYLICTDGLTDAVPEATMAATLAAHDGGRAAFELWRAAIEAGGADNITLALVEIDVQTSA